MPENISKENGKKDLSGQSIEEQGKEPDVSAVEEPEEDESSEEQSVKQPRFLPMGGTQGGTFAGGGKGYAQGPIWGKKPTPPGMPEAPEAKVPPGSQAVGPQGQKPSEAPQAAQAQAQAGAQTQARGLSQAQGRQAPQGAAKKAKEGEYARQFRSEQLAHKRYQARMQKLDAQKRGKALSRGKVLAGRMQKAAEQGEEWPYILAVIVSFIDDFIDIGDLSMGLGLDQFLDFIAVLIIFATRMFIKGQPGWITIRCLVFIAEFIPGVGFLPLWTIASIYSWMKARNAREQALYSTEKMQESQSAQDETQKAEA